MKSRAVSVIRGYPQVVLGEKEAILMHKFQYNKMLKASTNYYYKKNNAKH